VVSIVAFIGRCSLSGSMTIRLRGGWRSDPARVGNEAPQGWATAARKPVAVIKAADVAQRARPKLQRQQAVTLETAGHPQFAGMRSGEAETAIEGRLADRMIA